MTWAKLSAIRANCGIELTIDACLARLTARAREQQRQQVARPTRQPAPRSIMRARSPSWINLTAYGAPGAEPVFSQGIMLAVNIR